MPPTERSDQPFTLVPSVRESCGADDVEISSCVFGDVVPRPKKPLALSKRKFELVPLPKRMVDDAASPPVNTIIVEVELAATPKYVGTGVYGNANPPPDTSVPQKRMPPVVDFTSQDAEVRLRMARLVVVAFVAKRFPAVSAVDDAYGKIEFCVVEVDITKPTVGEEDALILMVAPRATDEPPEARPE